MKEKVIKCPYCGNIAVLKKAKDLFGERSIGNEYIYVCKNYPECNSYVTTKRGTKEPKGILANGDLRHKRIVAHKTLKLLWENEIMSKKQAYRWIQYKFSLNKNQAHIGFFLEYQCDELINEVKRILKNNHVSINF